jgi:ketosteroid isomerase-like protein
MGEQQTMAVVKESFAAVGRGDNPALLRTLTEDVEWVVPGPTVVPMTGTHRGKAGVERYYGLLRERLDVMQFEPREFYAQGDTVVVLGYFKGRVKATDRVYESDWALVYTVRDGKISRCREYYDTSAQVAAFRGE